MPFSKSYQIDYHSDYDFLSDEFAALYDNSRATVFQHPLWLHLMYKDLIPKVGAEPIVVTIRSIEDGSLKLVLPLVKTNYAGLSCIEPADLGICDYNAVIASKALEDRFFSDKALREKVIAGLKPVHLIFFRKMLGECDVVGHVLGADEVGEMDSSAHDVTLFAPYEDWKKEIMSSSFRKTLRRNRRKLEEFGEVRYEILTDADEIQLALDLMREQRALRYEEDLFQQDDFFAFYSKVAIEGAKAGLAQTSILRAGEDIVAVEFGLIHDKCYHFILGGIEGEKYSKLSPGILVMDYVLEYRAAQGDTRADFTIGDEAYKARYGATPSQLKHISQAQTMMGALALQAYNRGGVIKNFAKKVATMGQRKSA